MVLSLAPLLLLINKVMVRKKRWRTRKVVCYVQVLPFVPPTELTVGSPHFPLKKDPRVCWGLIPCISLKKKKKTTIFIRETSTELWCWGIMRKWSHVKFQSDVVLDHPGVDVLTMFLLQAKSWNPKHVIGLCLLIIITWTVWKLHK